MQRPDEILKKSTSTGSLLLQRDHTSDHRATGISLQVGPILLNYILDYILDYNFESQKS